MTFDFSGTSGAGFGATETDPIKLFRSLQVRDASINDLWLGQGDALRHWHESRSSSDVAVVLNTGAGKTLVGLVVAQSLVNETGGHVVYCCASIQLVRQTASKAASYGIPVTTYLDSEFSDRRYQRGQSCCVTTYQALFHGHARRWNDVNAIIFDDAHTASQILRSQFTLQFSREKYPDIFSIFEGALGSHLSSTDSDVEFRRAIEEREAGKNWLIPPFVQQRIRGDLEARLIREDLKDDKDVWFPWGHLRDKIDICSIFMSASEVTITPPVLPAFLLSYFGGGVRRVYLSATLAADDSFIRTFGRRPRVVVAPDSPAGRCERLILMPQLASESTDEIEEAKVAIAPHKALILAPTYREASTWADAAEIPEKNQVARAVESFRDANDVRKLLLVARYDGVDLPGNTCRVMVIHGLPTGLGPLERFFWERLRVQRVLRSTVASRVIQSFGRISRGMSDHGVVLLTESRLIDWISTGTNRKLLPKFLRAQVEVGFEVSEQIRASQIGDVVLQCLDRDPNWINFHSSAVASAEVEEMDQDEEAVNARAAEIEVAFMRELWSRDMEAAARVLARGRDRLFDASPSFGAWYMMWEGYATELAGDGNAAEALYRNARQVCRALPRTVARTFEIHTEPDGDELQVSEVAEQLETRHLLEAFDRDLSHLDGGTSRQVEESVRVLGSHLGLQSTRPDQEIGTGPDVLWLSGKKVAWSLELKTDKTESGSYSKHDVMQAKDHEDWVRANYDVEDVRVFLVGPPLQAADQANPGPNLRVVSLSWFRDLSNVLRPTLQNLGAETIPLTRHATTREQFQQRGLLWSQLATEEVGRLLLEL